MTASTPTPPADLVDEWIYLAIDHAQHDTYALVTGLTIQRNPQRFTPIAPLHGIGAHPTTDTP